MGGQLIVIRFAVVQILVLFLLTGCGGDEDFVNQGILVSATISDKYSDRIGVTGGKASEYYFTVYYFPNLTDEERLKKGEPVETKTPKKKESLSEFNLDLNIEIPKNGPLQTVEMRVDKNNYNRYNRGDKVAVFYLIDDKSKVRLKEEVIKSN